MYYETLFLFVWQAFLPQVERVLQTIFGERNPREYNSRELLPMTLGRSQDAFGDQVPDQQISNLGENVQFNLGKLDDAIPDEIPDQQIFNQGSTVDDDNPNIKQKELKTNHLDIKNTHVKLSSEREGCDVENAHTSIPVLDTLPLVNKFGVKCVNLCWLMRIRDPPVYIDFDIRIGDTFDDNIYRAYTRSGPFIKFLVWPALFLENGGAMLNKGVAQGNLRHPDA